MPTLRPLSPGWPVWISPMTRRRLQSKQCGHSTSMPDGMHAKCSGHYYHRVLFSSSTVPRYRNDSDIFRPLKSWVDAELVEDIPASCLRLLKDKLLRLSRCWILAHRKVLIVIFSFAFLTSSFLVEAFFPTLKSRKSCCS